LEKRLEALPKTATTATEGKRKPDLALAAFKRPRKALIALNLTPQLFVLLLKPRETGELVLVIAYSRQVERHRSPAFPDLAMV